MATETLHFEDVSGVARSIRVFNDIGQVLDFADDTFKALGSATTPYFAATERADMAGTGRSGYTAALDLARLNTTGATQHFVVKWYEGATPAASANPISEGQDLRVQFSELVPQGAGAGEPVFGFAHLSVTSTAGTTAHLAAWLIHKGALVDISGCTASFAIRRLDADANLFTLTEADVLGTSHVFDNMLRLQKASPGFLADRLYHISGTITKAGVTYPIETTQLVLG